MSFTFQKISPEFVRERLSEFMRIAKETIEGEYWIESNYLTELDLKWNLSLSILDDAKNLVGFLIASKKKNSVHIHKIAIDQRHQGFGLGAQAVMSLVVEAKSPITLKVKASNTRAISFYTRMNFKKTGQDEDMILMERPHE